jgi:ADP-ribose pyrophosphatase
MARRVEIIDRKREYDGFFKLDQITLRYERFDGRMSEPLNRLLFERGNSAAVLLYDEAADAVVLVNQFRYPAYVDDGPGWLWEVVAGTCMDEPSDVVVRKELLEEAGYSVERLEHIMSFYLSPGACSERMELYLGYVRAGSRVAEGGGLAEHGEDILVRQFGWPEAQRMLDDGEICDAKTIIALQHLALRKAGQL